MNALLAHLQTVHLTLVAATSIIFASVYFSDDSTLTTARHDLTAIQGLVSSWQRDIFSKEMEQQAEAECFTGWKNGLKDNDHSLQFVAPSDGAGSQPQVIDLSDFYVQLDKVGRFEVPDSTWTPATTHVWTEQMLGDLSYMDPPKRLQDFEKIWNDTEGGIPSAYIAEIEKAAWLRTDDHNFETALDVKLASGAPRTSLGTLIWYPKEKRQFNRAGVFDFLDIGLQDDPGEKFSSTLLGANKPLTSPRVVFTAHVDYFFFPAQKLLTKKAGTNWKPGTFKTSFPELEKIFTASKSIEIDQATPLLKTFEEKTGKQVTILGVEMPAQGMGTWALILLVLIQIYLLINLYQVPRYASKVEASDVLPWIGSYEDMPSKILTVATICVYPPLVIAFVRYRLGSFSIAHIVVSTLLIITSIYVAMLLWQEFRIVWSCLKEIKASKPPSTVGQYRMRT